MKNVITVCAMIAAASAAAFAQTMPWQNPQLSFDERAADLVKRLTIEEKAQLMLDISEPIPRLGIKKFNWWSEALHGVANQGDVTVFPEPIGMAASFNPDLVFEVFNATSDEMRAKYNAHIAAGNDDKRFFSISVWTPNVNIFRDPRWGRGQETYGEDPYLTSRMGVQVVRGLQGPESSKYKKLLACAKHFAVHSGPEYTRHTANINDVSPRDLRETYLPAFKALVQEADVREVMCAYQRWDDEPCCGSTRLLQKILRDEWGFQWMVVSDCSAVSDFWQTHKTSSDAKHAAAVGVLAGTDVECGYDYAYKSIPDAVRAGLISEADVDEKVHRLLVGRFSLGELDDPSIVEWSKMPESVVCSKENHDLSLRMARQTITLLQNKGNVLPLKKGKVAVIGPNADNDMMMWGNYNGTPKATITILDGIQAAVGAKNVKTFRGCDYVRTKQLVSYYDQCQIDGKVGMRGTFWNKPKLEGEPDVRLHVDRPLNVSTFGNYAFAPGIKLKGFSARYETIFRPAKTEKVLINVEGCSYFELFVDGKSLARDLTWRQSDKRVYLDVEAGKEYNIEIRYTQVEDYNANLKFNIGVETDIDYADVMRQLKGYDVVVFCGGIAPQLEGEEMPIDLEGFRGGDRTNIELPTIQRTFLAELKKAGKKVILVNCSGSTMAFAPETETCDAIVQAWYSGEAGGQAIADVLYGKFNPSGKLPLSFYGSSDKLPDYEDYSMKGRTYRYTNDVLFPFGFGLSYTTFAVGEAQMSKTSFAAGEATEITIPLQNTGKMAGAEVLQVYIKQKADVDGPLKSLRAFKRVELKAGERQDVTLCLDASSFEFYDESILNMRTQPGEYEIFYGTSSADKDLKKLNVTLQ